MRFFLFVGKLLFGMVLALLEVILNFKEET